MFMRSDLMLTMTKDRACGCRSQSKRKKKKKGSKNILLFNLINTEAW